MTEHITDIARVIQLAVAPVFLLAGVGAILAVLTGRLNRIIDRVRVIEEEVVTVGDVRKREIHAEFARLAHRARLISRAIMLASLTGLIVCILIVTLFVGDILTFGLARVIALLFVLAMLSFSGAFVYFLREILYATAALRIGPKS
jgi:hypothetical protein